MTPENEPVMNISNKKTVFASVLLSSAIMLSGCDENELLTPSGSVQQNSGTISAKHFNLLFDPVNPAVYDIAADTLASQDVTVTISIGDRNNRPLTDPHVVYFETEWGLIDPSCTTTTEATCTVTWRARKDPRFEIPDGYVTITAYTLGEEEFIDSNGNGLYDDGDAGFIDLREPFIDADNSGDFSTGDTIIDRPNEFDPAGTNLAPDDADNLFNGRGCTHSSECSTSFPDSWIYDQGTLDIFIR